MSWFKSKRIFLDYASATPVLPEVRRVMEKYWSRDFYNASAIYGEGMEVKRVVEECRVRLSRALGIASKGTIFTSGGTESDNLAVLGTFEESKKVFERPHIIVSSIEHPAVVAAAEEVVRRGGEMSILPVNEDGLVSLKALEKLLKENTFLVSIALANHEIGTVQPLSRVGRLISAYRKEREIEYPYLHTDASSAANYLNINLEHLQVDLLTLDGSKIYGPKGVGVLAVRSKVKLYPIIFGGGQEGGRRAGTPNPALISGFTLAFEMAQMDKEKETTRLEKLRDQFISLIRAQISKTVMNGSLKSHLPNIVSVSILDTLSEFILLKLDKEGIMASVGSACSLDERVSGSPVIRALGKPELAESTLRFSFGRFTTENEIKKSTEIFCRICRSMVK